MDSTDTASVDDAVNRLPTPPPFKLSEMHDRHIFLCYKSYDAWPSHFEDSETDLLPKLLASALKARKDDMKVKTKLTICGGCDGIACTDGDVLVFPEMVKYRGLKELHVERFVDDVLVNGKAWDVQEPLSGAHVFVCAHAKRHRVCGECGPILIKNFMEEITSRGLTERISVYACSHFKYEYYKKEVIIFRTNSDGTVTGDWFSRVAPNDVPGLIDRYIGRGEIIEKLWRGQMGVYEEEPSAYGSPSHCPIQ